MPQIVLATLNAKYIHASFGLRYLKANLGELADTCQIQEFDINQRPLDIVEALLRLEPRIIGLGVYIWNVAPTTEVVASLKRLRPELRVVIGGPEVSYELENQPIAHLADYVITGEADLAFNKLCRELLGLESNLPAQRVIVADLPRLDDVALPYHLYDSKDIEHRIVYVEASRGCPFSCEFCLSSLDIPVRAFPLGAFLGELEKLLERGVKQFKFVDRTFNLNLTTAQAILEFFLKRQRPGLFVHFEMIPDRLPAALRDPIAQFPPGSLQFEVGIQSFNPGVCQRISRRQDLTKLADNLYFLRTQTGVHIHADLIVGLPGETIESFGEGFDRLVSLRPHEIQVGMLKRLRGTPIVRHDMEWQMIYNSQPPYEILQNKSISFAQMQRMRRFARYWDLLANSGNFLETTPLIWSAAGVSPFAGFLRWSDWLHEQAGQTSGIALSRLVNLLFDYLTRELGLDKETVRQSLTDDYCRGGRKDVPNVLRAEINAPNPVHNPLSDSRGLRRQARHWGRGNAGISARE